MPKPQANHSNCRGNRRTMIRLASRRGDAARGSNPPGAAVKTPGEGLSRIAERRPRTHTEPAATDAQAFSRDPELVRGVRARERYPIVEINDRARRHWECNGKPECEVGNS